MSSSTRTPRDRRYHHRADVHLAGESVLLGNALSGVTRFTTETLDLSEGGAKIALPEELPLGQLLDLHLHLRDGTDHVCRARVLRSGPAADRDWNATDAWAAVQFIEPDVWMQTAIAAVISGAEGDEE